MGKNVVITGLGVISPAGIGVDNSWFAVKHGIAQGNLITNFNVQKNHSKIGAQLQQFNSSQLELYAQYDRVTQFAVLASREAWCDSGLDINSENPAKIGVCIGTAVGGVDSMEKQYRQAITYMGNIKPETIKLDLTKIDKGLYRGFNASSISSAVATDIGATGFCTCVATGCTAGIDSIGSAFDFISQGVADVIIAGASEAPFSPIVFSAFDNIHCLTTKNDKPTSSSRPFDKNRDGFLLGEGAGILILEEEMHAFKRGASIYGRVLGYASISNAYHMTNLMADGAEQSVAIQRALNNAKLNPDSVSYFNMHGTSTKQNDISETAALKRAFGEYAFNIPASSTKSVVGHALGAASAIASVMCFKAITENVIPPTANYDVFDPECDLDYVPNFARDQRIQVVGCNASGFSGIHTTIFYSK